MKPERWEYWCSDADYDEFSVGADLARHSPDAPPYMWTNVAENVAGEDYARLIAAAPELLRALRHMLFAFGDERGKYPEAFAAGEAAVAKAEGE